MNILHLESQTYTPTDLERLQRISELDCIECNGKDELRKALESKNYHSIFLGLGTHIDSEVLDFCQDLKVIVTPTTGLNHLDLKEAAKRNIQIVSLKGEVEFLSSVPSTAELTWTLLLALQRRICHAFDDVKSGKWRRKEFKGSDLYGKSIGILGLGRLGKMVAKYAQVFGMKVMAHDMDPVTFNHMDFVQNRSLEDLLRQADIISIHLPHNQRTNNYLNERNFQLMKSSALLINTARGEIVDESALLEALKNGTIAGAALDVLRNDSCWTQDVPEKHPLVEHAKTAQNLLISPHIGGYGAESIEKARSFVTAKFLKLINSDSI